jgi:hypothetical protein
MSVRDNEHAVPLMSQKDRDDDKPEPLDLEANSSSEPQKAQNLDHEYSIPSTIKFAWLGTYFVFSLALTLHNKLVLGSVSPPAWPHPRIPPGFPNDVAGYCLYCDSTYAIRGPEHAG